MESRGRRIGSVVRFIGIAVATAVVVLGIYLPTVGAMDWALLPFLLAFVPFALADAIAWIVENGAKAGDILWRAQSHPLR